MTTFAASVTIVDLPVGTTVTGAELLARDKPARRVPFWGHPAAGRAGPEGEEMNGRVEISQTGDS